MLINVIASFVEHEKMRICFPVIAANISDKILLVVGHPGSFIPKKPIIVSHNKTSLKELPDELILVFHISVGYPVIRKHLHQFLFLSFLFFLKWSQHGLQDSSMVLFTQTSAAVRRRGDAWPPFGVHDASPIYDVPMVQNEAIII